MLKRKKEKEMEVQKDQIQSSNPIIYLLSNTSPLFIPFKNCRCRFSGRLCVNHYQVEVEKNKKKRERERERKKERKITE